MIKKMKRLSVLLHRRVFDTFLDRIQEMGLVHVDIKEGRSNRLSELMSYKKRLAEFLLKISKYPKLDYPASKVDIQSALSDHDRIQSDIDEAQAEASRLKKTIDVLEPWGDMDPALLEKLRLKGINILYYKTFQKQFSKLDLDKHHIEIVKKENSNLYFVVFQNTPDNLLPIENIILPESSLAKCREEMDGLNYKIESSSKEMQSMSMYIDAVNKEIRDVSDKITFYQAEESCEEYYDGKITTMTGWIPEDNVLELEGYLKAQNDIVYIIEDVPEDLPPEEVPIILKNDRFSSLFEPIAKLFDLPNYRELDLTPFFAPFYVIFYGFCVGDSGYGLVLLIASVLALIYLKKLRSFAILGIFLSLSIIFWGLLSGTSMGVNTFENNIPVVSDLAVFKPVHLFYMALLVGLFQILFGMTVKAIKYIVNREYLGALSPLGWFILLISLVTIYLNPKSADPTFGVGRIFFSFIHSIPLNIANYGAVLGIALILFFNDMRANVFLRFGKGLWELYGITGVVGDLLSYIRLFALGLSSAILGSVVNMIAVKVLEIPIPGLSHLIFILFLIVGHFGNLAIAGLGAFVHPLRLTFVEFYKNAGFVGGGMEYRPLKKTQ
jgi:V/A-type H+-transporting ATPase subunit I